MNSQTDPLATTLFILGDFPQPTQTFIQREMVEMRKRGISVQVMALLTTMDLAPRILDRESADAFGQNGRTLIEAEYDVRQNVDEQIALLSPAQKPSASLKGSR